MAHLEDVVTLQGGVGRGRRGKVGGKEGGGEEGP